LRVKASEMALPNRLGVLTGFAIISFCGARRSTATH
jgi:hypothetical protein